MTPIGTITTYVMPAEPPIKTILCGDYVTEVSAQYVDLYHMVQMPWYFNPSLNGTVMAQKQFIMSIPRDKVDFPELVLRDNLLSWLYRRDMK
jgi:hypothetical protein